MKPANTVFVKHAKYVFGANELKKPKPIISKFEQALDFLALAHKADSGQSIYANIDLGFARSFNMIVGLGCLIEEDLCACPNVGLLSAAISRCTDRYAITQLSDSKLLVRSGEFHAYIPCAPADSLSWCLPDGLAASLDDRFLEALEKVGPIAKTKADTVVECSIQLNNGSVVATNNSIIMEAWHGNYFPDGLLIPKLAIKILQKTKKKVVGFGFSKESVTFYFEDKAWLYSRLFQDRWPDVNRHLNVGTRPHMIPEHFFSAFKKVEPFSIDRIYVEGNRVSSHPFDAKEEGGGLALEVDSMNHAPRMYTISDLKLIAKHAKDWDESGERSTLFFGENLRGVIWHGNPAKSIATEDENIPF